MAIDTDERPVIELKIPSVCAYGGGWRGEFSKGTLRVFKWGKQWSLYLYNVGDEGEQTEVAECHLDRKGLKALRDSLNTLLGDA